MTSLKVAHIIRVPLVAKDADLFKTYQWVLRMQKGMSEREGTPRTFVIHDGKKDLIMVNTQGFIEEIPVDTFKMPLKEIVGDCMIADFPSISKMKSRGYQGGMRARIRFARLVGR